MSEAFASNKELPGAHSALAMAEALGPGLDPAQVYFKMLLDFVVFYFVFLFKIVSLKLIRKYCLSPASLPALSSSLGGDKTRTLLEPGDSPH